MSVRLPGLLGADLTETARLNPTAGSVTLQMVGSSEATLTLPEGSPTVSIHDWVSICTQRGPAGIFRVSNVAQNYKRQIDITLLHGIDILADSVWAAQTSFSGTKTQFLTQLLNQQTHLVNGVKPWVLGTCEDTGSYEKDINYDRLSNLLEELVSEGGGYYFTYDQSSFPWTLSLVARPQGIDSEFRLTRNVRSASVTYNDADLCTRLHLSVSSKHDTTANGVTDTTYGSAVRTYDNTAAQAVWGVVVKTADIDTHDDIEEQHFESADAWAQNFLAQRAEPSVQIQIDGDELKQLTGDSWDELSIGKSCQVALPAYGHTFVERVVSVTYPDLFKDPAHVTVSLANTLPKVSENIANAQQVASVAARSARASARSIEKDEKEITTWSQKVQYHDEALDGTGVLTLYESGIDMDASGGVTVYSLQSGLQALYAGIQVNSTQITAAVGDITSVAGRVSAIEGSSLWVNRDSIATITGKMEVDASGNLVVKQGSGLYVTRNNTKLGVWDSGNLTAGVIVDKINGDSTVTISADRINLTGYVTATQLDTRMVNADALFSNQGYVGTIRSSNINVTGNVTGQAIIGQGLYFGSSAPYTDVSTAVFSFSAPTHTSSGTPYITYTRLNGNTGTMSIPDAVASFGTVTSSGGTITIPFTKVGGNTGSINFNIADTAYYQSHVGMASSNPLTVVSKTAQEYAALTGVTDVSSGITGGGYYLVTATAADDSTAQLKFQAPAGGTRYATGLTSPITLTSSDISSSVSKTGLSATYSDGTSDTTGNVSVTIDASAVYQAGQAAAQAGDVDVVKGSWTDSATGKECEVYPASGNGAHQYVNITTTARIPTGTGFDLIGTAGQFITRDTISSTTLSNRIFYLAIDGNYVYASNTNDTPTVGTNAMARIDISSSRSINYVVSSGDLISVYSQNGQTVVGYLYPNTDVSVSNGDSLRYIVQYNGRSGYVYKSNVSSQKGSTNYPGHIGWWDEVSGRTVTLIDTVVLASTDTGISTHNNVGLTYSDGSGGTATVTVDASAISGGGTQRSVSSLSQVSLNSNHTSSTAYPVTVTYDDGTTGSSTITVSTANYVQTNKTITYTANGTYTLSPTSPYDAMSSASITVNVPGGTAQQRTAIGLADTIVLPASHTGTATISGNYVEYDDDTETGNFPVRINAAAVYQAGVAYGQDTSGYHLATVTLQGRETKFKGQYLYQKLSTTVHDRGSSARTAYIPDNNGSYKLQGTPVGRSYYGTLYQLDDYDRPVPVGSGSWFLVSGSVGSLYKGDGTALTTKSLYYGNGGSYNVCGDYQYCYVIDAEGTVSYYSAGQTVSDTYYTRTS